MKKFVAILILIVLLFNWVGYQIYTTMAESEENRNMITRLDNDQFSDSDLVSIKIPIDQISPYANQKGFERINGQIEIRGRVFNYVKRRISHDSLEFLCIPNDQATLLRIAKYDFFKLVADLQAEQSKKTDAHNNSHKNFTGDYISESMLAGLFNRNMESIQTKDPCSNKLSPGFYNYNGQPPQIIC